MKLVDGIAAFIRTSLQKFDDDVETGEEEEALFLSYIKRMAAFSGFLDLRHWDLWDMLLKVVSNYDKEDSQRDVRERCMQMLFMQLCFDVVALRKDGETPKAEQVRKVKKRRDQLIRILSEVLSEEASGVEQAYLSVCDLMTIFGCQIAIDCKAMEPLIWRPDEYVIGNLKVYLKVNVFEVENLEEMANQQERIVMMHKMRQLVAQYAKLVIHGSLPISDACELMRRYQSHFSDFGDIFKNLLSKCREIDFVDTGLMIVETLKILYQEMEQSRQTDPVSEAFNSIRDLAKRLAPAFGGDYRKNRYAVTSLHKKTIDFAFEGFQKENSSEPPNIYFLEIAIEFSNKLLAQDKLAV
uniref:Cohesin subunit SCC3/SA HEAT-repeats domain-containing protein n=1 Tax=Caenorhabditis japonica TaxID=281687 RepID=A0A8R1IMN6_CAEJA